jgi:thymidylate synthase (FAD)
MKHLNLKSNLYLRKSLKFLEETDQQDGELNTHNAEINKVRIMGISIFKENFMIQILTETTKNPITLIGQRAGICWGSDTSDKDKNFKRGIDCLDHNHGRTFEFVNVEIVISGYSARVIREWYTHIGGAPTRLQASTRYIDYKNFEYVVPKSILSNDEARQIFNATMDVISVASEKLEEMNIPREDIAMMLPLGMTTKIVDKRNLRSYIDMAQQRMCARAYWEYRELFKDICNELSKYSGEWNYLIDRYFMPKCDKLGYCPEKESCGRHSTK